MEIKDIIAKNIQELRRYKKWTQMELAERLNYTDKTISKWERGESTPDVDSLFMLAKIFGVTVDYFFHEQKENKTKYVIMNVFSKIRKMLWLFVSALGLELIALIIFLIGQELSWPHIWISFIWALIPISILTYVFFYKIKNWLGSVISGALIVWFILAPIYLTLLLIAPKINMPFLFLLGIPISGVAILLGFIYLLKKKRTSKNA